jgi:putative hydrolase of the HAD superfamily
MKVLMLDVDGVVVTGRPRDGKHPFADIEAELGVPAARLQEKFFAAHWPAIIVGHEPLEPRLAAVLAEIAPDVSSAALIDYWFSNDSRLDEAVLDSVGRLRAAGIKVVLATNQEHRRAAWLMDQLGLARHVDGIAYSAALGHRKPMPEFYAAASALAGAAGNDLVLVDDVLDNVEAAIAAGWRGVHWTGGQRLEDALGWSARG